MSIDVHKLIEELKRDEGYKDTIYKCSADKLTLGYGHNCEDNPISESAAKHILLDDVGKVLQRCERLSWWHLLNDTRKRAIVNMVFNIGMGGMLKFKKMIAAIEKEEWVNASAEMKDSKWARQVGKRAWRLIHMMATGY